MAENINVNELLEAAKQYGIELTEDQLDGIAGGEILPDNAVGLFITAHNEIRGKIMEIKNAKDSGISFEDFIAGSYGQASDDLVTVLKFVWQAS